VTLAERPGLLCPLAVDVVSDPDVEAGGLVAKKVCKAYTVMFGTPGMGRPPCQTRGRRIALKPWRILGLCRVMASADIEHNTHSVSIYSITSVLVTAPCQQGARQSAVNHSKYGQAWHLVNHYANQPLGKGGGL
jgi:hypothetical protein